MASKPSSPPKAVPPPRGVLSDDGEPERREHRRVLPPSSLSEYVAHFWTVRWALREPRLAETLPHPTFHVVFERSRERGDRGELAGVPRGRFSRWLCGDGSVFGVKFRPGMFQPLLGARASTLTGKVVPLAQVFGAAGEELSRAVFATDSLELRAELIERFLLPRFERIPESVVSTLRRVRDLVENMASDHRLLRVEAAAELLGNDVRTLQRHFSHFVGVTPKWVILRYRLHEAAERLRAPQSPSLAALAAELGYADQAHFARDFRKWVGRTPGEFALGLAPNVR